MTDIVFINPPLKLEARYGSLASAANTMPSLGLLSMAANLKKNDFGVAIIESGTQNLTYSDTLAKILNLKPRFVGITATTVAIYCAVKIAGMVKESDPGIKIVIGGPHLTAIPEKTMELFPEFDIGVVGEGEETVVELMKTAGEEEKLQKVAGLIYRQNGQLIKTGIRPLIKNLDFLPYPAWDLLQDYPDAYRPPPFRFKKLPAATWVSSRGCPHNCIFCDRSVFGNKYRSFSPGYVVNVLKHLKSRYGVNEVLFEDDTLMLNQKYLIDICELIIKEKLKISWSCLGRVDNVSQDLFKIMKKAGCWHISYGIETGSTEILKFINKKVNLDQIEKAVKWTKKAGIYSKGFFILGHPMETEKTLKQTLDFAKKLKLDDISVNMLTPYPATKLNAIAKEYGTFDDDWTKMNQMEACFIPNGLSQDILNLYFKKFWREFYLRPSIFFSYFMRLIKNPIIIGSLFNGFIALIRLSWTKNGPPRHL